MIHWDCIVQSCKNQVITGEKKIKKRNKKRENSQQNLPGCWLQYNVVKFNKIFPG